VSISNAARVRTDVSDKARGRAVTELQLAWATGIGDEAEADRAEEACWRTRVTERRTFPRAGGVGGVAIQVGSARKSSSGAEDCEDVISEAGVCIVVVGVHTGEALIGGIGRNPHIVSLRGSGDGDSGL
jgi:hypothetical protein